LPSRQRLPAPRSIRPELLDVDVHELARPRALVPGWLLEPEPAEPPHPDRGQDPGNSRQWHRKRLGDLCSRHPQPAQLHDHRDPLPAGAVRHPPGRRGTIEQLPVASAIAANPLARTAHANASGLGHRRQRPALINNTPSELAPGRSS